MAGDKTAGRRRSTTPSSCVAKEDSTVCGSLRERLPGTDDTTADTDVLSIVVLTAVVIFTALVFEAAGNPDSVVSAAFAGVAAADIATVGIACLAVGVGSMLWRDTAPEPEVVEDE